MDPLDYGASRPPERDFTIKPYCDLFLKMDALDGYALMQAQKFLVFGYCNGGVSATILAALHLCAIVLCADVVLSWSRAQPLLCIRCMKGAGHETSVEYFNFLPAHN